MIYFITARSIGRVKIGYSNNPYGRLTTLRTACPAPLEIERICDGGQADEKGLHQRFAQYRVNREWFEICPEIDEFMATLPFAERPTAKDISDQCAINERRTFEARKVSINWQLGIARKISSIGMTLPDLSRKSGVPYSTLRSYFHEERDPKKNVVLSMGHFHAIASALPEEWMSLQSLKTAALARMRGKAGVV